MKIVDFGFSKADSFVVSKHNIRKQNIDIDIDVLADSIQHFDILKPVMIDEKDEVIDGQKRILSIKEVKNRCNKEVLVPWYRVEFDSEEEKLLASLVSNERRSPTEIADKGNAILLLREAGYTLETLEKLTGTPSKVLSSYATHVITDKEIEEKHPEVKDISKTISDRKKKVLKKIIKFPPYSEDIRERVKLWNSANDMTLKQLEAIEKDVKKGIKVDIDFRTTKTVDASDRTFVPLYPFNRDYKRAAERCEAEGKDIQKVLLALLRAWANHEIDYVDMSSDL